MSDAYEQIQKENDRRHRHNEDQSRCRHCANFVDKGEPENGQLRYHCKSCDRHILEWVGNWQSKAESD
jgi:transposase-like protein